MKLSELIQELTRTLNQKGDQELIVTGITEDGFSYSGISDTTRYLPGRFILVHPKPKYGCIQDHELSPPPY